MSSTPPSGTILSLKPMKPSALIVDAAAFAIPTVTSIALLKPGGHLRYRKLLQTVERRLQLLTDLSRIVRPTSISRGIPPLLSERLKQKRGRGPVLVFPPKPVLVFIFSPPLDCRNLLPNRRLLTFLVRYPQLIVLINYPTT